LRIDADGKLKETTQRSTWKIEENNSTQHVQNCGKQQYSARGKLRETTQRSTWKIKGNNTTQHVEK
jgi:hypothetical protein